MNPFHSLSLTVLCFVLVLTGCETTSNEKQSSTRRSTTAVEVFRDGAKPAKAYKEIGTLKDDGKAIEQEEIEAKMIKQAKKLGGDAILFEKPRESGMENSGFGGFGGKFGIIRGESKFTYLYKGTVVVFE